MAPAAGLRCTGDYQPFGQPIASIPHRRGDRVRAWFSPLPPPFRHQR